MRVMSCEIRFPKSGKRNKDVILYRAHAVQLSHSWKELTGRAVITLPRNVRDFDRMKVREIFRHGDAVQISLGYDDHNTKLFEGYVTKVSADIPITITCEDEMWKLKRIRVNYANNDAVLQKMLEDICPGYQIDALEGVQLGSVRFSNTTVAQVLEKLQSDFSLYAWFKNGVLYCGKYYAAGASTVTYDLERNVVDNNLTYINKEDVVVKIKGTSLLINGDKLEAEIGEDGGEQMELTYYNVTSVQALETKIKHDYDMAHRDKYEGSLTGYGNPLPEVGGQAQLQSSLYPDREGQYYIDGVDTRFDSSGYRQSVSLGPAALDNDNGV